MVAIAQFVGVHTLSGQILLYAAPAVSVIAGAVIYQLKLQMDWHIERSWIKKARKTLENELNYPHTSEEHKANIRKDLEELGRSLAAAELARIKSFGNSGR